MALRWIRYDCMKFIMAVVRFKKVSSEPLIKKSVQKYRGLYVYIGERILDIDRLIQDYCRYIERVNQLTMPSNARKMYWLNQKLTECFY